MAYAFLNQLRARYTGQSVSPGVPQTPPSSYSYNSSVFANKPETSSYSYYNYSPVNQQPVNPIQQKEAQIASLMQQAKQKQSSLMASGGSDLQIQISEKELARLENLQKALLAKSQGDTDTLQTLKQTEVQLKQEITALKNKVVLDNKTDITRTESLSAAKKEASGYNTKTSDRDFLTVFNELDKNKDDSISTEEMATLFKNGYSTEQNISLLKQTKESKFNTMSKDEKLKLTIDNVRNFLEATNSPDLLNKLNQLASQNKIKSGPDDLPDRVRGVYNQGIDMIGVNSGGPFTEEMLSTILLHELVHAMSPGNDSLQEEADARILGEEHLDLYNQGEYGEYQERYAYNGGIKDSIKNLSEYQGLPGYSKGHSENGDNFISPIDRLA